MNKRNPGFEAKEQVYSSNGHRIITGKTDDRDKGFPDVTVTSVSLTKVERPQAFKSLHRIAVLFETLSFFVLI